MTDLSVQRNKKYMNMKNPFVPKSEKEQKEEKNRGFWLFLTLRLEYFPEMHDCFTVNGVPELHIELTLLPLPLRLPATMDILVKAA